ncbi:MAG: type I DNA topoisomerase [Candidatus Moraniibacteriota bacterium]|nr:MAG: type I DNA topoisomerase [Candidatus Moranbacteria bacterium]
MKLLIVESPTKAKTIKKFLPKGYEVISSFGHLRDLPKSTMGIDIEHDFEPKYVIARDKQKYVKEIKKLAEKAEIIILASDEDREGEAISWHLRHILDDKKTKREYQRIVFHEITKSAIETALQNPREIDLNLVNAQQARRILDRLVGYELSPLLQKKIRRGLSAGRVQSVALRFIVEREKERESFSQKTYYTFRAKLSDSISSLSFEAHLLERNHQKIEQTEKIPVFSGEYSVTSSLISSEKEAVSIKKDLESSLFSVESVEKKQTKRTPQLPFTTSTLQQSAINRLGFSSKQTMSLAQKLYEQGLITYMRTDSVNLSRESVEIAKNVIERKFGKVYALSSPRFFKNRSKRAQEAHEAIRPSYPEKSPDDLLSHLDSREHRLYKLIWERFIASQMAPAILNIVRTLIIAKGNDSYQFSASGSSVEFDGFLALSSRKNYDIQEELPPLEKGNSLDPQEIFLDEKETSAPPRYNEASLIKILEEREIGRPSTYTQTLSTLFTREYIDHDENKRLYPLEIGKSVCDLLSQHFTNIVDIDFTATMEKTLDDIADGQANWVPVIENFYHPFHENLENKTKEIKKEIQYTGEMCPECGKELIIKHSRHGSFTGCSNYPECSYIKKEVSGEMCPDCGNELIIRRGRFGSFTGCSNYPECSYIKKDLISTGILCPNCKTGEILERKSRRGKVFYGCNGYPKCKTAFWDKPTADQCPQCHSLLVQKANNTIVCSNKECLKEKSSAKKSSVKKPAPKKSSIKNLPKKNL